MSAFINTSGIMRPMMDASLPQNKHIIQQFSLNEFMLLKYFDFANIIYGKTTKQFMISKCLSDLHKYICKFKISVGMYLSILKYYIYSDDLSLHDYLYTFSLLNIKDVKLESSYDIDEINKISSIMWDNLSANPTLTIDMICNHITQEWDWIQLTINKNVYTAENILKYPNLPWKHEFAVFNPNFGNAIDAINLFKKINYNKDTYIIRNILAKNILQLYDITSKQIIDNINIFMTCVEYDELFDKISFIEIISNLQIKWPWDYVLQKYGPDFGFMFELYKKYLNTNISIIDSMFRYCKLHISDIRNYMEYYKKNTNAPKICSAYITMNSSITIKYIENNADICWNYDAIMANPNLSYNDLKKYYIENEACLFYIIRNYSLDPNIMFKYIMLHKNPALILHHICKCFHNYNHNPFIYKITDDIHKHYNKKISSLYGVEECKDDL